MRVAQVAPIQAPIRLPASRLTATNQYGDTVDHGTETSRAGSAVSTTSRLIALFITTACSATKPNTPISSGSRNSAPPRPIIPPSTPTNAPAANAPTSQRRTGGVAAVVVTDEP